MPFHDWTDRPGWEGMRLLWITELLRWVKPRLPPGYRVFIGSAPVVAVGAPPRRPDVGVSRRPDRSSDQNVPSGVNGDPDSGFSFSPDIELAVSTLEPGVSVSVEKDGRLIAAIELISPRNKDRPDSRVTYLSRYLAYLHESVHLLLVDVHRRPIGFSFSDQIAAELSIDQQPMPAPLAVSYRVGDPAATGGRFLAIWRRAMTEGATLPTLPLALDMDTMIPVNLELTYNAAASLTEVE
jgi:Protein of unknown function (DUF4058)